MSKKSVSDFQFGSRIGEGSYSTVFKAVDVQNKKLFAIKVLSKKHIVKEKKIKYVNIEKTTLNRLGRHPGIVTLYYTFQDENSLYFVIDLAEYGELLTIIRKLGSLSEICSRFYMIQLIDAVEFMHRKGVIHRDLKPENILVNGDMRLMITDFGAAKIIDESSTATTGTGAKDSECPSSTQQEANGATDGNTPSPSDESKSSFVGTAEYVSPELLKYNRSGKESDIWAMGCILYQFITGYPPFKGTTEYLTFEKIVGLQYQWPAYYVPEAIKDLVGRILALDPAERPTIEQIKQHKWFHGFNFADKSKIWSSTPPKFNAYNPMLEQQINNQHNKVLVKKQPIVSVKKQNLNNTIREIRSGNESALLYGPSKIPNTAKPAPPVPVNQAQYKKNPPAPLRISSNAPSPSPSASTSANHHAPQAKRIPSNPTSPVTLTKPNAFPYANQPQSPLQQTSQQIKPQTIDSSSSTPRSRSGSQILTPLSSSSGRVDQSLATLQVPPKVPAIQGGLVQSPTVKTQMVNSPGSKTQRNLTPANRIRQSASENSPRTARSAAGVPLTSAGKGFTKGLTPPASVKTNNGLVTPASSGSVSSSGGYYTPQEKNGSVSTPVKKQNDSMVKSPSSPKLGAPPSSSKLKNANSGSTLKSPSAKAKTIPALKSPTAPPPDSITCQLSESETPVKLDFIHGASLVYSSLKSITKSKDSLDDLTINTIITNHSKELQEETRGMVLMITDVGLLYLFDLPDSEDPEYDLLLKVTLTDRSFAMYDYEFDEQLHSGYLILEDVSLDLLMFISPIPRFQILKLLDGQAEFKIGNDMTWIEALMKTKKLLKSKKSTVSTTATVTAAAADKGVAETTKRQTATVNASKQKAAPTSSPINIKQQPLKKSSTPPLSTPPSMNKSPITTKKPTATLPISPIPNYTANAKPVNATERKALNKKFAGSGAAAAYNNLK